MPVEVREFVDDSDAVVDGVGVFDGVGVAVRVVVDVGDGYMHKGPEEPAPLERMQDVAVQR